MTAKKNIAKKYLGFSLLVLAIMLSSACGTKLIRGESPMVRLKELSHQDDNITLKLSMRNLNGVALDIDNIDFSLATDDKELFSYHGPADTNIIANGTETWSVEVVESEASRELLDSLQNGDVKSLPYELKGSVKSKDDGSLHFQHEGHLYPLPGRPGRFR